MKRVIFACLIMTGLTLGVNAQDKDKKKISSSEVPAEVVNKFNSTFAGASDVEWKQKDDGYKVSFEVNGADHHAIFNSAGDIVGQGQEVPVSELPSTISEAVTRDHPDHQIDKAHTMVKEGVTKYKISLDGSPDKKVMYSADGTLLKDKVEDD